MTRLVGLMGYAGAGKDAVGNILVGRYGWGRVAFADALKEMVYALDPFVEVPDGQDKEVTYHCRLTRVVDAFGWDGAKGFDDVRRLLQRMGTEAGRKVLGEDVWVKAAQRKLFTKPSGTVLTDVRFPNEIDMIKNTGGELWRVDRPGVGPRNDHVSEHAWTGYGVDVVILNNGSLAALADVVDHAVRGEKGVIAAL
jgi:hypothetical protein